MLAEKFSLVGLTGMMLGLGDVSRLFARPIQPTMSAVSAAVGVDEKQTMVLTKPSAASNNISVREPSSHVTVCPHAPPTVPRPATVILQQYTALGVQVNA